VRNAGTSVGTEFSVECAECLRLQDEDVQPLLGLFEPGCGGTTTLLSNVRNR